MAVASAAAASVNAALTSGVAAAAGKVLANGRGAAAASSTGAADSSGLPADFASLLASLQTLAGDPPVGNDSGEALANDVQAVLAELKPLKKSAHDDQDDADHDPVDIAGLLGQLAPPQENPRNPENQGIAALTPAAIRHPDDFPQQADDPLRQAPRGLEIAVANMTRSSPADNTPGKQKPEISELSADAVKSDLAKLDADGKKPDFSLPEVQVVPQAVSQETHRVVVADHGKVKIEVATPAHSPNWSNELGERVVWMAKNDIQEAQISVHPPHLGPIEISLSIKDDNASARFTSPHAEVREILEDALPRLREILAEAGVQLGQADVGAQSQQAFQQFAERQPRRDSEGPEFGADHPILHGKTADIKGGTLSIKPGNGLVDTFV